MSISALCQIAGISRQAFYKASKKRQRRSIDSDCLADVVRQERQVMPREGGRKLHKRLQKRLRSEGIIIGRDRFFELLKEQDLLLKPLPKQPKTTNSRHSLPLFHNQLPGLHITHSNQVWLSDITDLKTEEGYLYLSLITDHYSRRIVGYHANDTLETEGCLKSLRMALETLSAGQHPIHHSDRGSQYCSHLYVGELQKHGLGISMTEENHCYENAIAERLNGILKQEFALGYSFKTKKQAIKSVHQAVYLYNNRRLHTSLKLKTPMEVFQAA